MQGVFFLAGEMQNLHLEARPNYCIHFEDVKMFVEIKMFLCFWVQQKFIFTSRDLASKEEILEVGEDLFYDSSILMSIRFEPILVEWSQQIHRLLPTKCKDIFFLIYKIKR